MIENTPNSQDTPTTGQNAPTNQIQKVEGVEIENAPEQQTVNVDVDMNRLRVSTVAVATLAVLAVIVASYFIYRSLFILLLLFMALLVATAIEPIVNLLRRGPFNRSAGILIVYTGIFVTLGLIGYFMFSVFFAQLETLSTNVNRSVADLRKGVEEIDSPFIKQQVTLLLTVAQGAVQDFAQPEETSNDSDSAKELTPEELEMQQQERLAAVGETTRIVAETLFAISTVFVVAFYWLNERTLLKRAVMTWFPPRRANRIRRVWDDIEVKVGGYVRGQLILMTTVGVLSAIAYFIIGVEYWPALALFIAIAEAIPLVGPYIGTAPAVLVALTQPDGVPKALAVVLFAIVLQAVEGNILVPRIMKNSVGISPLAVILSILLGATLAGIVGALVAVPIAGAIQVVVSDLKAARESDEKLAEATEQAKETRSEAGELVVAYPDGKDTKTSVESTEATSNA